MTVDEVAVRFRAWVERTQIETPTGETFEDWFRRSWQGLINRFAADDQAARAAIGDMPLDEQKRVVAAMRDALQGEI